MKPRSSRICSSTTSSRRRSTPRPAVRAARSTQRNDVPAWHPDVRAWEVRGADGRHVGLFFGDYFARPSKRSGAWMTTLRDQEKLAGDIRPLVVNVMNFAKAGDGEPTLLQLRRRAHAVPRVRPRPARASVRRDLSDGLRHQRAHRLGRIAVAALRALAGAARILRRFAIHYQTGAPMPDDLLKRLLDGAQLQPGLRHGRICRLGAGRSRLPSAARAENFDVAGVREGRARAHRHAGGDRDAAPAAAFRARVLRRRLCRGLLQLHVVGGARRRRLRGVRGDRRHLRSCDGAEAARPRLFRRRHARSGGALHRVPRPAADARRAAARSAASRLRRPA